MTDSEKLQPEVPRIVQGVCENLRRTAGGVYVCAAPRSRQSRDLRDVQADGCGGDSLVNCRVWDVIPVSRRKATAAEQPKVTFNAFVPGRKRKTVS